MVTLVIMLDLLGLLVVLGILVNMWHKTKHGDSHVKPHRH